MQPIKLNIACLALLLFSTLLFTPYGVRADDLDQLLSTMIIGTWEEGKKPYGVVTFSADGNYQAQMYASDKREKLLLSLGGTWTIKDSELHSILLQSSSLNAPVGEAFVDKIVQINREELVLIGVDGERYSKYRVKASEK